MTKPKSWYKIAAAHDGDDGSHAEILIYDEIGRNFWGEGIAAEDLVKELAALDVDTIAVRINSVGGQVFEGLAIFNALARHRATVTTHIDGMAASIASIIALAGDEVRIADNAFMMIHNPWGVEIGDANAMRKMADILDTLGGSLADIYTGKTGATEKSTRAMMDAETWFNAEEALEAGLVDEVDAAMDIAASLNTSRFQNVRGDVLERVGANATAEPDFYTAAFEAAAAFRAAAETYRTLPEKAPEPNANGEGAAGLEADDGPSAEELLQLSIDTARTLADTRP